MSKLKIFSGSANVPLAKEICEHLDVPLGEVKLKRFSDGEVCFQILENVRGRDVFLIQPTGPPVAETLVELLVMIDAFKRASARRLTAVIPYYGYARQDRKDKPRVPISAKLVGDLLSAAGAHRLLTVDLHANQQLAACGHPPLREGHQPALQKLAPSACPSCPGEHNHSKE